MGHPEHGGRTSPMALAMGKRRVGKTLLLKRYLTRTILMTTFAMLAKGVKTISLIFHYPRTLDLESEQRRGSHSPLVT